MAGAEPKTGKTSKGLCTFQEVIFTWFLNHENKSSFTACHNWTQEELGVWMEGNIKLLWPDADFSKHSPDAFYVKTHEESLNARLLRSFLEDSWGNPKVLAALINTFRRPVTLLTPFMFLGLLATRNIGKRQTPVTFLFDREYIADVFAVPVSHLKQTLKNGTAEDFFDISNDVCVKLGPCEKSPATLGFQCRDPNGKQVVLGTKPRSKSKAKAKKRESDSGGSDIEFDNENDEDEDLEAELGPAQAPKGKRTSSAGGRQVIGEKRKQADAVKITFDTGGSAQGSASGKKRLTAPVSEGSVAQGSVAGEQPQVASAAAGSVASGTQGSVAGEKPQVASAAAGSVASGPQATVASMLARGLPSEPATQEEAKALFELLCGCHNLLKKASPGLFKQYLSKQGLQFACRAPPTLPLVGPQVAKEAETHHYEKAVNQFMMWFEGEKARATSAGIACNGLSLPKDTGSLVFPAYFRSLVENCAVPQGPGRTFFARLCGRIQSPLLIMFFLRRLSSVTDRHGKSGNIFLRCYVALQESRDMYCVFFVSGDAALLSGLLFDSSCRRFVPLEESTSFNERYMSKALMDFYRAELEAAKQLPLCCARRIAYESFKRHPDYAGYCEKYRAIPAVVAWLKRDLQQDPGPIQTAYCSARLDGCPLRAIETISVSGKPLRLFKPLESDVEEYTEDDAPRTENTEDDA